MAAMAINPEKSNIPFNPYIVLIGGIIGVSTGAIFARLADAPALVTAAYRVGLAALILIPFDGWKVGDELRRLSARDIKLAMLSGLFLALHFATWISSLDYTAIANSVVLVNTIPLWVGLLTPLITGDRILRPTIISIMLSVIGGGIIGFGDFATGGPALWGDFLALVGAFSAAIYLLLGRNLRRKLSLLSYVAVCYGSAALILWLVVLVLQILNLQILIRSCTYTLCVYYPFHYGWYMFVPVQLQNRRFSKFLDFCNNPNNVISPTAVFKMNNFG